jgi:hypothetical protein
MELELIERERKEPERKEPRLVEPLWNEEIEDAYRRKEQRFRFKIIVRLMEKRMVELMRERHAAKLQRIRERCMRELQLP